VLGHDLRNPLAAIDSGAHAEQLLPLDDRASKVVKLIRWSNSRMSEPINNISEFAQGRMGRGLAVSRVVDPALGSSSNMSSASCKPPGRSARSNPQ